MSDVPLELQTAIAEAAAIPQPALEPDPEHEAVSNLEPDREPETGLADGGNDIATYIVAAAFWGVMILVVAIEALRQHLEKGS